MKISWITLLFITLTDRSLRLRQKLWRGLYNKIVSTDKSSTHCSKSYFSTCGPNDFDISQDIFFAIRYFAAAKNTVVYKMLETAK